MKRSLAYSILTGGILAALALSPTLVSLGSHLNAGINDSDSRETQYKILRDAIPQDRLLPEITITKIAIPNIVMNGDRVTYTITLNNTSDRREEITVIDSIGEKNRGWIAGVAGGRAIYVQGSEVIEGLADRYITGSLRDASGLTLENISPYQTIVIKYDVMVSDEGVSPTSYSPVRNESQLTNVRKDIAAIRILGSEVNDRNMACSSPASDTFPDPSSQAQLICYENYLTDTGEISGPNANPAEVAPILAREKGTCTYSASRDYVDIDEDYALQCAVSMVHDLGLMDGYADGSFRPNHAITRAEFTRTALRAAGFHAYLYTNAPHRYSDVAVTDPYFQDIVAATTLGVISGYADGSFRPNKSIQRDEATKVLLRAFGFSTGETTPAIFIDLDASDPLSGYVTTAGTLGIVEGRNGYFFPNDSITRAEVAKIISKLLGYLANGGKVIAS